MSNRLGRKYKIRIFFFYGLIILLLSVCLGLSAALSYWIISFADGNYRLSLLALFPLVYALYAVYVFLSYKPHESHGITVTKESAPKLFALIDDVADKVKYKGDIEEVVLTPGMSVSVNYTPNLSNFLFESKAKLHIGILVCRSLSADELSAVIAHELAHFSQPTTKYKAYIARIANISSRLGTHGAFGYPEGSNVIVGGFYAWPARVFVNLFGYLFEVVFELNSADYTKITTEGELDADKISARATGTRNLLSALCKSYAISNRLVLYKKLILPYLSSLGYRCDGYWTTFQSACSLFRKIDNLDITTEKLLLDLEQTHFAPSESIFALRLDSLRQNLAPDASPSAAKIANDLIPTTISDKLDSFLCRKYGQTTGEPVGPARMSEILADLNAGLFADVHSMPQALALLEEVQHQACQGGVEPIFMPEDARPSGDVLPTSFTGQPSDEIYSSAIDICPVCGGKISEDTNVCPHCHEIISE